MGVGSRGGTLGERVILQSAWHRSVDRGYKSCKWLPGDISRACNDRTTVSWKEKKVYECEEESTKRGSWQGREVKFPGRLGIEDRSLMNEVEFVPGQAFLKE